MPTLIIAEIGINHNRSLKTAMQLADVAKVCGADVCKTQLEFPTDYCLTYAETLELYAHCEKIGITFACTAFDIESLWFLLRNCKLPFIKIASGKINHELLKARVFPELPVILSTGGCDFKEIEAAYRYIKHLKVTMLHCVSEYPTPLEHENLSRMLQLRERFELPVGLSDHSANPLIPALAVTMGASVIECHLTLDRNQEGPDHKASLDPVGFAQMVRNVRDAETALKPKESAIDRASDFGVSSAAL